MILLYNSSNVIVDRFDLLRFSLIGNNSNGVHIMKIYEIDRKYFNFLNNSKDLLEAYSNPSTQLDIRFRDMAYESGVHFIEAMVSEKDTNEKVIMAHFTLDEREPNMVSMNNIYPLKLASDKQVHTSLGASSGHGSDMGTSAVRWLMRKVIEYSKTKGFDIKNVISSSRETGARAKNNPSDGDMPTNFNVAVKLKETLLYNSSNDTLSRKTS